MSTKKLGAIAACLTSAIAGPAWSQEVTAQQTEAVIPQASTEQTGEPSEIVVTATRRSEALNDVPLSIQALSGRTLTEQGAFDFNSYSKSITGISALDRGPGQQLITLRGVSSDTSATNTDAPEAKETTAIYFDETPVSLSGFNPDLQLVDIDRVEVLKGPQGTLFGAGALAGVVRIITQRPNLEEVEGRAEMEGSTYDGGDNSYAVSGTINIPVLRDGAAIRVTGYTRSEGGFIDNIGLDADRAVPRVSRNANSSRVSGLRAQFRARPISELDINLKFIRQETKLDGTQNIDVDPSLGGTPNLDIPSGVVLSDDQQFRRGAEPYRDRVTIFSSDATANLRGLDIVSATSFIRRRQSADIDFTNATSTVFGLPRLSQASLLINGTEVEDFVQEIRLVSTADGPFRWVIGGFYNKQNKVFTQSLASAGINRDNGGIFGSDSLLNTTASFDDRQFAGFGEASYELGQLKLTAGLRYFDFKSIYNIKGEGAAVGGVLDIAARETKDSGFNPKVNVSYKPDEELLVYLQAARGFRLGGINDPLLSFCSASDAASFQQSFGSDKLWNYEAGFKATVLDKRVQINAAVYHIDWTDAPVTRQLACGVSNTATAGTLKIDGIEVDTTARVTDFWRLSGGFAYVDSRFDTVTPEVAAQTGIVSGERTPGVARWTANLSSSLELPLAGSSRLYSTATYQYTGSIYNYAGTSDPRRFLQPAYSLVNLRLGVRRDNWNVAAFLNNVFDKRAILFRDRILGETRDTINRPRSIGINVSATF
jgi:iron complex outermembrane recepter protein